jgi:hypothetical protein
MDSSSSSSSSDSMQLMVTVVPSMRSISAALYLLLFQRLSALSLDHRTLTVCLL